MKNIEIIGEAAKNVPDEIKANYSDIQWRVIAGMRDRLAHGYLELIMRLCGMLLAIV